MLNMTRIAAVAATLLVVAVVAMLPRAVHAQATAPAAPAAAPAAPAPPAAPAAAPAAPAPPAAAPAPAAKGTEVIDNPYGLEALWKGGDFVAKTTLIILVIMSMGSWYIIITKLYEQYKMGQQARAAEKSFWSAPSVRQGADGLKKSSPFRFIAESGLEATSKHVGLLGNVDMNEWITMSIQRAIENVQSRTQDGLCVPGHGGIDGAVRRAVRYGMGHLSRADRDRHRRPGVDRQGRGTGRRSADHDRDRPRRGGAGGAWLQLAGAPQQVGDGARARLRCRPACACC